MLKVYTYQGCSTCKAATKWLKSHGVAFDEVPVRETPPTVPELKAMLKARGGELRALFNTSGQDYRALGIKDKLPSLPTDGTLALLAGNGNLVKRPFAIDTKHGVFLVGFREPEWQEALEK